MSIPVANNTKLLITPNPAHTYFTISGNYALKSTLTIMDVSGKKVMIKNNIKNNERINIESLPNGIYIVKIGDGNTSIVIKMVVE